MARACCCHQTISLKTRSRGQQVITRCYVNHESRFQPALPTLENFRQLSEKEIAVVSVLNGELPLPDYRIDIEKHLSFLFAPSDEDFDRDPIAGRCYVEPAASGLREVISNVHKREWETLHPLNFGWEGLRLKRLFQVEQKNTCI